MQLLKMFIVGDAGDLPKTDDARDAGSERSTESDGTHRNLSKGKVESSEKASRKLYYAKVSWYKMLDNALRVLDI